MRVAWYTFLNLNLTQGTQTGALVDNLEGWVGEEDGSEDRAYQWLILVDV